MEQLSEMFNGHQLRIMEHDQEPLFLLRDVCEILELGQVAGVRRRLDDDVISNHPIQDTLGRTQQATFVNEDGLYDVILDSRKPEAKSFRKWITSEILPSIRKNGSYQLNPPSTQLEILQGAVNQMVKQEKRVTQLEGEVNTISNIVSMDNIAWRDKVKVILKKIAKNWTGVDPYRSVIQLSYDRLEKRAGCRLDIRLTNRKERAAAQGMSKSYVQKINKLDVIAEEKRLVEIYIQVVKEMAIQFKININDFKFEEVV
ncbi:BRO family protein [Halobacillus sp. Cin3]|uniref:BRO-N domain-containing protein n=1 Tax=Halobacillus sp. Cin3 TaxID=2928441 RepID=UPI00248F0428|nr:BRO family protein [Halobacillus sp. Cin3]